MTGFYVAGPTFAPDEFASFEAADGSHRIFAWLVPITTREGGIRAGERVERV
jgi:hypothetical protein